MNAVLIIPALNEEDCIAAVIREVRTVFSGPIVVADNGSTDATAARAAEAGAIVTSEPLPGYGRACRAGVVAAPPCDIYIFMDGDGSDRPADIPPLLQALENGADLALAVRRGAGVEPGSIAVPARLGNWLSGRLIGLAWGQRIHDLSPLKAIRVTAFERLQLREETYGWTLEMIARSATLGLEINEIDAGYRRRRAGESKVSGQVTASAKAGARILATLGRVWLRSLSGAAIGTSAGLALAALVLLTLTLVLALAEPSSSGIWAAIVMLAWPVIVALAVLGRLTGTLAVHRRRHRGSVE